MIASRLDDPGRGAIIVEHQRLHEDDLTGHLLPKGGWRHISLPLVAEEEANYRIGSRIWTRQVGEPLVPALYPPDDIRKIRADRGEAIFATQYQQNPMASQGELLQSKHIRYFDELPAAAPHHLELRHRREGQRKRQLHGLSRDWVGRVPSLCDRCDAPAP
jgi:hypothetical protein